MTVSRVILIAALALLVSAGCKAEPAADEARDASEDVPAWTPQGFDNYDDSSGSAVWWRWVAPGYVTCSEYATSCWQIEVVSEYGCPNGLYAALNFLDANQTAVGYTNASLPALVSEQVGRLTFDRVEENGAPRTGQIAEISCY